MESLLLRETETFAGLENQMEMVKGAIKEIGCFYVDRGSNEGDAAFSRWETELKNLVASRVLEEWTELEEGALPRLKYLHFHSCSSLRMLPEGLQFVTTVEELVLLPLLDEHEERLKPDGGVENYKIRNIPKITFIPESVVASRFNENSSTPPAPATDEE